MNPLKKRRFIFSIFFISYLAFSVSGQDWRKIVPLETTCEEIKTILNVDHCKPPVSNYKFPRMSVNLNVSDGKDKWKVPKGTITQVIVSLTSLPSLKELGENLDDFEVLPDGDLPNSKIYRNDERGIEIVAQKIWRNSDEMFVTSARLYPPKPKKKQISIIKQ